MWTYDGSPSLQMEATWAAIVETARAAVSLSSRTERASCCCNLALIEQRNRGIPKASEPATSVQRSLYTSETPELLLWRRQKAKAPIAPFNSPLNSSLARLWSQADAQVKAKTAIRVTEAVTAQGQ